MIMDKENKKSKNNQDLDHNKDLNQVEDLDQDKNLDKDEDLDKNHDQYEDLEEEEQKKHNPPFHGFPENDNVQIKTVLDNLDRTFLPVGSEIGKYNIIEEIDRGGMAVVYKACQKGLDRIVALKVLPANVTINASFVERFLTEAQSVAKLGHPNIVTIFEVSVEKDIYFLAMDYIPGQNLFYYLNQKKPKLVQVLEIVRKLACALDYAHEQKILHRDLKLNNVIMRDNEEPILIDFGLAKIIGSEDTDLTRTGEILGSPAYMAPERIFGKGLDSRSDVCSLGIMLYEMLTFKNPYFDPRSIIQTTKNVVEANPVTPRNLVSWLPIEVESITLKAMNGDPDERYQTMKEFAEDIHRYQIGEPVLASPPSIWSKIKRFLKKHWAPIVIGSIVLLFTILLIVVINIQSDKRKSHWQLTHSITFDTSSVLDNWHIFTGQKSYSQRTGSWNILDSTLYVESQGYTFIRLEHPFTRDIKVEFDIKAGLKDLFNAGLFFYGSNPDSGYSFEIHSEGEAINGTRYPGSHFLFYNYCQAEFPIDSQYHVTVERKNNIVSFWLNEVLISRLYDFFPVLGKEHQKLGFFVNGSTIAFDNLKIYRRTIPRLARPTIVADRFFQQGNIETALAEYKEVLLDISTDNKLTRRIKFKIINCLIRIGSFEEASTLLTKIEDDKKISETDNAQVLFLRGILNNISGLSREINYAFFTLAKKFPNASVNKSISEHMVKECNNLLEINQRDSAETRIAFLTKKYPGYSYHFGRIHLRILNYYSSRGFWKKSRYIGKNIASLHSKNDEILFEAKILMAKKHLGRRNKYKAIDILNQCIGSSQPSIAKWHAWMVLAEVYEYEHNYNDAYTIYKKVFNECPKRLPISWMARIRMGEMAKLTLSPEKMETIFESIIQAEHVFAQPRLIAQFYSNLIDLEYFRRQWLLVNPGNMFYLYHLSLKAMMEEDHETAILYLKILLQSTSQHSWEYVRINNYIDNINTIWKFNE